MGLVSRSSATVIIMATVLSGILASIFIPGDIVTALGVIYSRLPPSKIGTDSRLGFGLRLGRNTDAQFLFEFGPQTNTQELGNSVVSKKRDTVDRKKYSNDKGWRWFLKTVNSSKQKPQKKFTRDTDEIRPVFRPLDSFTEPITEMQLPAADLQSSIGLTTILPVSEDLSETTSAETVSTTKTTNQLFSTKYNEDNTFDTNNIIEKYNKKKPMLSEDVFRLINSLMNILPKV